ncbi:MAG: 30S ribosomal protein S6 [Chloroflexota bacterium]
MKRAYEIAFIVRMDPNQAVIDEAVDQVQAWIEADELGEVKTIDRWGQRRLAYEIDSQRDGYYVILEADIDPAGLPEFEENMKLSSAILRYLIIRQEG